jgi:hypothetical protein
MTELQRQGIKFLNDGGKLKVVFPKSRPLPEPVKNEIRRHHKEILARITHGGVSVQDVLAVFPGSAEVVTADLGSCARCGGQQWWVSQHGMKVCEACYPPVSRDLVVVRIGGVKQKAA